MESWARRNIAEFPDRVAEARGVEVWSDARGRRVPTTTITSHVGTGECLGGVSFLELAAPRREPADRDEDDPPDQYVFGAGPEYAKWFAERDRRAIKLPADAVDTGYHRGAEHHWLSPDRARAYVGSRQSVDLWPRSVQTRGCA